MIVLFVGYFFARLHGSPLSETCKMFELRRWPSHASMPLLGNFARHFTSFIFDLFWPHNVDDLCLLDWIQSKLVGGSFSTSTWYISQRRCSSTKRSRWTRSRRWGASREERSTWGDRRPLEERGLRVEEEDVDPQSHQKFAQSPEVSAATEHLRQSKPPGGNQAVANEKSSISLRCLRDLFCLRRASWEAHCKQPHCQNWVHWICWSRGNFKGK